MEFTRETGRRFVMDNETITTRRVKDGDKLNNILEKHGNKTPQQTGSDQPYSDEIMGLVNVMIRDFHDYMSKGKYYIEPGFRHLIGKKERIINVHYLGIRDDWEPFCRKAFDLWEDTGFKFIETDLDTADIVIDDEKQGAWARKIYHSTGRRRPDGTPIVQAASREINISKLWPAWNAFDAILHEIGHAVSLGHGGLYNGSGYPKVAENPHDHSGNSIMSYYGPATGKLGPADYAAISILYG